MSTDPQPIDRDDADIRPVVRTGSPATWGPWVFGGLLLVAAVLLFQALDSRRRTLVAPSTLVSAGSSEGRIVAPPPLDLPPRSDAPVPSARYDEPFRVRRSPFVVESAITASQPRRSGAAVTPSQAVNRTPTPAVQGSTQRYPAPYSPPATSPNIPPSYTAPVAPPSDPTQPGNPLEGPSAERVRASRLAAPGFTVPQGTVIAAVLETALDSTKPGFARALVSRDVKSFDGSRVLVPRGSRLFGEYEASLEPGQNRALIRWMRLTRPDGVRMELDSPSADALGRAGIRGKVDTKFLQRFGGAILQSVLDIGVGLATRPVRDRGVIVALPGSSQVVTPAQQQQVQPTLRVKQGSRVTVFVARDLDFSGVDP